jgi:hypothetical protein
MGIEGTIHLTHAARADGVKDLVRAKTNSGRKRHIDLSDFTNAAWWIPPKKTRVAEFGTVSTAIFAD